MPMMKKIKKKLTKAEKEERKKVKVYRAKINKFIGKMEEADEDEDEITTMSIILNKALKKRNFKTINAFITEQTVLEPVIKDGETVYVGVS